MENPTKYRGFTIRYVVNDVAPDTLTACIEPPSGARSMCTSERIFGTKAEWHRDIRGKVDAHPEAEHPEGKSLPESPLGPL